MAMAHMNGRAGRVLRREGVDEFGYRARWARSRAESFAPFDEGLRRGAWAAPQFA